MMRRLLPLLLLAGCTTADQWKAAAVSGQFTYIEADGGWSLNKQGHRSGDTHSYGIAYTITPGKYWEMQMQAEMTARAITEAQYAEREPVVPEEGHECTGGGR